MVEVMALLMFVGVEQKTLNLYICRQSQNVSRKSV